MVRWLYAHIPPPPPPPAPAPECTPQKPHFSSCSPLMHEPCFLIPLSSNPPSCRTFGFLLAFAETALRGIESIRSCIGRLLIWLGTRDARPELVGSLNGSFGSFESRLLEVKGLGRKLAHAAMWSAPTGGRGKGSSEPFSAERLLEENERRVSPSSSSALSSSARAASPAPFTPTVTLSIPQRVGGGSPGCTTISMLSLSNGSGGASAPL